jgi:hypothetical protein
LGPVERSECLARAWQPGLGDPSPAGLVLTGLYGLASLLALRLVLSRRTWAPGEARLWWAATSVILVLTANKQLDLHHWVQRVGHCLLYAGDQAAVDRIRDRLGFFLIGLFGLALLAFLALHRRPLAANRLLALGLTLMALFVELEAARFTGILPAPMGDPVEIYHLHRILEALALLTLSAAAWTRARR